MNKEKIQKLKKMLIKKADDNNKKSIENLIVFIVLLIITIIAINIIWGDKNKDTKFQSQDNTYSTNKQLAENDEVISTINKDNEYNLEENLENILSKIVGVGDVKVLITYCETSEIIPMYNETYSSTLTEETDTEGRKQKNKPGRYE